MKTFKTIKSNKNFPGFVFAERPDSDVLYSEDLSDSFYIEKVVEVDGMILCYCDRVIQSVAGAKYVTNPDWPVAKYRLGERVLFRGKKDVVQECTRTSNKHYQYALEDNGAWHNESSLKPFVK